MIWVIVFFTAVLVVDCLLLTLLVLVQLPKKEAGLGMAFGAGATDALFGAGSGNALTKMTKYATAVFFVATLMLSVLNAQYAKSKRTRFQKTLETVPIVQPPPQIVPTNQTIPSATSLTNAAAAAVASNAPTTTPPAGNAPVTPPATATPATATPPAPAEPATPAPK